jgi:hypothetical protein
MTVKALGMCYHHICSDMQSVLNIFGELSLIPSAETTPLLQVQYIDYAYWMRSTWSD